MRTIGQALGLAVAVAALGMSARAGAATRVVDRVAATVNDDMISLSEVYERAALEIARLEAEGLATSERRQAALQHAMDDLIADRLLTAEEKAHNIEVSDADVELAMEDVMKQNNMDRATFERALASQGQSVATYREKMRKDLAAMKLIGMKVRSKVKVSDEDLKAEYARRTKADEADFQVHARHIVIQVPKDATPQQVEEARVRAEALTKKARAGEDFVELVKKFSEGASRDEGGDLGFFGRGEMVPAFDKVAFSLQPGEVSEPVRTPFGWHVLKVLERRAGQAPPFEQVRDELRERLVREQMQRQTEQYVADLRRKASVDIKIPDLAAPKGPTPSSAPAK